MTNPRPGIPVPAQHPGRWLRVRAARALRSRGAGPALTVLLLATLAVCGCGASLPGLRGGLALPGLRSHASPHSSAGRIEDARELAGAHPAEPYWPYRLAALYASADSVPQAEDALRRSLACDSSYAPALALLSRLEFAAGRHDEAIRLLESARATAQQGSQAFAPELLAGLALHYDAIGQHAKARDVLAAAPRMSRPGADVAAVVVALHGGAPDTAADLAEAAMRAHPNSAACRNNYGVARLRAGDPKAARRALLEAIQLDPSLPGPYYNLAILEKYYTLDDEAAARWFTEYRARAKADPDGLAGVLPAADNTDLAKGK